MGRIHSVNFSQQAIGAMQTADPAATQHVKEAIRYLCLHPTLGKSLKLQPSGLKALLETSRTRYSTQRALSPDG